MQTQKNLQNEFQFEEKAAKKEAWFRLIFDNFSKENFCSNHQKKQFLNPP